MLQNGGRKGRDKRQRADKHKQVEWNGMKWKIGLADRITLRLGRGWNDMEAISSDIEWRIVNVLCVSGDQQSIS